MKTFNRITLLGRVGRAPEVRVSQGGVDSARFPLATDRNVREGEGWATTADWHNILCFERVARTVAERVTVGDVVLIDGELRYERWQDEAGQTRRTPRVVARTLSWLGRPEKRPSLAGAMAEQPAPEPVLSANEAALPEAVSVPF